mmetsp:Transcript_4579/g.12909  ORF Transcript_4579/g.12909 Transcript_4579/m.12909 type:complete len:228 (+) Transcript_4579:1278-1961(+)|eukprot:scaffold27629_cov24-Tisochrysis_lutea.AAC.2
MAAAAASRSAADGTHMSCLRAAKAPLPCSLSLRRSSSIRSSRAWTVASAAWAPCGAGAPPPAPPHLSPPPPALPPPPAPMSQVGLPPPLRIGSTDCEREATSRRAEFPRAILCTRSAFSDRYAPSRSSSEISSAACAASAASVARSRVEGEARTAAWMVLAAALARSLSSWRISSISWRSRLPRTCAWMRAAEEARCVIAARARSVAMLAASSSAGGSAGAAVSSSA